MSKRFYLRTRGGGGAISCLHLGSPFANVDSQVALMFGSSRATHGGVDLKNKPGAEITRASFRASARILHGQRATSIGRPMTQRSIRVFYAVPRYDRRWQGERVLASS
jgi:hypothetical protein